MNRYHFALRIPLVRQSRGTQFLIAAGSHTDWCWFFFLLLFRMNAKKTLYSNSLSKIWGHAQWFCCSYEYNFSLFHKYVLLCLRWRGMVGSVIFLFFKYLPQSNSRKTVTHKWLHKTPAHFPLCVVYWSQWIIMSFFYCILFVKLQIDRPAKWVQNGSHCYRRPNQWVARIAFGQISAIHPTTHWWMYKAKMMVSVFFSLVSIWL